MHLIYEENPPKYEIGLNQYMDEIMLIYTKSKWV